jgi:hypothetical protein
VLRPRICNSCSQSYASQMDRLAGIDRELESVRLLHTARTPPLPDPGAEAIDRPSRHSRERYEAHPFCINRPGCLAASLRERHRASPSAQHLPQVRDRWRLSSQVPLRAVHRPHQRRGGVGVGITCWATGTMPRDRHVYGTAACMCCLRERLDGQWPFLALVSPAHATP